MAERPHFGVSNEFPALPAALFRVFGLDLEMAASLKRLPAKNAHTHTP